MASGGERRMAHEPHPIPPNKPRLTVTHASPPCHRMPRTDRQPLKLWLSQNKTQRDRMTCLTFPAELASGATHIPDPVRKTSQEPVTA